MSKQSKCRLFTLLIFFLRNFIILSTLAFSLHVYLYDGVRCWIPLGLDLTMLDAGFPWTGLRDDCEMPCEYWELNRGPIEKQQILLIVEPSLQP